MTALWRYWSCHININEHPYIRLVSPAVLGMNQRRHFGLLWCHHKAWWLPPQSGPLPSIKKNHFQIKLPWDGGLGASLRWKCLTLAWMRSLLVTLVGTTYIFTGKQGTGTRKDEGWIITLLNVSEKSRVCFSNSFFDSPLPLSHKKNLLTSHTWLHSSTNWCPWQNNRQVCLTPQRWVSLALRIRSPLGLPLYAVRRSIAPLALFPLSLLHKPEARREDRHLEESDTFTHHLFLIVRT